MRTIASLISSIFLVLSSNVFLVDLLCSILLWLKFYASNFSIPFYNSTFPKFYRSLFYISFFPITSSYNLKIFTSISFTKFSKSLIRYLFCSITTSFSLIFLALKKMSCKYSSFFLLRALMVYCNWLFVWLPCPIL